MDFEKDYFFHIANVSKNKGKTTTRKHYHELFEIYYLTHGSCRYFIDNKAYQLLPGDVILIPENTIHNSEYDNTIHSRLLINCSKKFVPDSIRPIITPDFYLYRNKKTAEEIRLIFEKIKYECEKKDNLSEEVLISCTHMLFFIIARNLDTCETASSENEYIMQAVDYLKENFTSKISLNEIAKMCCISVEHFCRTFKKETGFSFNEYLNLLRLQKAENILSQSSDITVSQLSALCGFSDSNYFSHKFKAMYGISPKKMQILKRKRSV